MNQPKLYPRRDDNLFVPPPGSPNAEDPEFTRLMVNSAKLIQNGDLLMLCPECSAEEREALLVERTLFAKELEKVGIYDPELHGLPDPHASHEARAVHVERVGLELVRNALRWSLGE